MANDVIMPAIPNLIRGPQLQTVDGRPWLVYVKKVAMGLSTRHNGSFTSSHSGFRRSENSPLAVHARLVP